MNGWVRLKDLPVCIETKQVHALYALLSQRPDTKQHAIIGISACSRLISVLRWINADCQRLLDFCNDPLEGDRCSVVGKIS
jgi:hypothetical protein